MTPAACDPVVFGECSVILACLVFLLWWFSPGQRRQRRLVEERDRQILRRIGSEPVDGAGGATPVSSSFDDRQGRT
jgi:hypothetical protein